MSAAGDAFRQLAKQLDQLQGLLERFPEGWRTDDQLYGQLSARIFVILTPYGPRKSSEFLSYLLGESKSQEVVKTICNSFLNLSDALTFIRDREKGIQEALSSGKDTDTVLFNDRYLALVLQSYLFGDETLPPRSEFLYTKNIPKISSLLRSLPIDVYFNLGDHVRKMVNAAAQAINIHGSISEEPRPIGELFRTLASRLDHLATQVANVEQQCSIFPALNGDAIHFAKVLLEYVVGGHTQTWIPIERVMEPRESEQGGGLVWGFPAALEKVVMNVEPILHDCERMRENVQNVGSGL